MTAPPEFSILTRAECEALLASQHVGRLAYTFRDRVDIEPIHFVFREGYIYGRTQVGAKVDVLAHHPWVAFEADVVASLFDWRSVVVRGRVEFPDPNGSPKESEKYQRAVDAFRSIVPGAFDTGDPTPHRQLAFLLPVQEMSGRASATSGSA